MINARREQRDNRPNRQKPFGRFFRVAAPVFWKRSALPGLKLIACHQKSLIGQLGKGIVGAGV